ncbi:hypothetical protein QE152_g39199 [Popillia japonica]|uniref:Uncharacterized protein n=1 Tax=Popillia japonica TaxID=7064 RepID=A0AAW1HUF1_POPJA
MDSNFERFEKGERQINTPLRCYHEIYDEKKRVTKQTKLTKFFSKATTKTPALVDTPISLPPSPLPGPSTAFDCSDDKADDERQ